MWYIERDYCTGHIYHIYKIDEKIIIRVYEEKGESGKYTARVYEKFNDGVNMKIQFIQDNDFDVLKFKCLVKANELGWNIKSFK